MICRKLLLSAGFCFLVYISPVSAVQYSIESDITARVEYNDNIFVTSLPHDSVYGLTVIPQARMVAREADWETYLNGKVRSNNYSDSDLDSNDVYLDFSGSYDQERNIFTLGGLYHKDSNLNAQSTDFGIAGRRVNRKKWSVTPQYQRLLTERSVLALTYSHIDVDYIDAEDTAFVPYKADVVSGSVAYNLTERDKVSIVLQATDYLSKNNVFEYQLYVTRVGIEHAFTELWSGDFTVGGSRRNSTNRITQTLDFFGQPVTLTQEVDFSDDGYVLDAGISRKMETGSFLVRISRDNVPNSFGGLNEVNSVRFSINQGLTERWRYTIDARYEDIDAVATQTRSTDREVLFFEPRVIYRFDRHWAANASYRYIQRSFKSDLSDTAPHSNRVYLGMTYNFSDISTF